MRIGIVLWLLAEPRYFHKVLYMLYAYIYKFANTYRFLLEVKYFDTRVYTTLLLNTHALSLHTHALILKGMTNMSYVCWLGIFTSMCIMTGFKNGQMFH